ncbi:endonuclease domain-containing protein [Thiothrix subterranea]|uniref:Endonuclease domain-containing protein n=1 Tax=Thiothrix subterranea TaxID=2735563 RepID=A0AA51R5G7_9GAMM|nr:endonuclease domain-containing protein [Thiothrix subterranea]MDQ5768227.1 endonuclease domain-containing protein [Thiothrix subterranea]WML87755.1 endonuclease domain-containing protein [Thiothrix subterranea]
MMKSRCYQPYHDNLVALARVNRKNPTPAEYKMWSEILRRRQLTGFKFLRQKPIDGYIVDFYCATLALAIEIDGDSHADKMEYDTERTRILNAYDLQIIRYTNDEVLGNPQGVYLHLIEQILARLEVLSLSSSPDKGRLGGVSSA